MAETFTVEVEFTDRTTSNGAFVTEAKVVQVLAGGEQEASLVAAQIVASTIDADSMVVQTTVAA
jgi:hypothetical protein